MQNHSFAIIEGEPKLPLLPSNDVARHRERGALRLNDSERLEISSQVVQLGNVLVWPDGSYRLWQFYFPSCTGGEVFNVRHLHCHCVQYRADTQRKGIVVAVWFIAIFWVA
jgi:hypothetical protein